MLSNDRLLMDVCNNNQETCDILLALAGSSRKIYDLIKDESKLEELKTKNSSNDTQIKIDVLADRIFVDSLCGVQQVAAIASEERKDIFFTGTSPNGYGVSIDPVDGSKSARVGIPSGSIFGVFKNVSSISDFTGSNIFLSGFFLYGVHHELFVTNLSKNTVSRYKENPDNGWNLVESLTSIPSLNMLSINASNFQHWPRWIQAFYNDCFVVGDSRQAWNMRWYASLVSEVKRVLIEGGLFCYPGDNRTGYQDGHLRLVYEAIPMAHLICSIGGAASDGKQAIMQIPTMSLHQKTPLFLGEKQRIEKLLEFPYKIKDV